MRSAGIKFVSLRSWNVAACLIAVLAMFASAASACACNHHQSPVKVEAKPSCHGSSHAEPAVDAEDSVDSNSFRSGCSCFVSTRVPAITAKPENKKFAAGKITAANGVPVRNIVPLVCAQKGSAEFEPAHISYSNILLSSGPSRAPPRL